MKMKTLKIVSCLILMLYSSMNVMAENLQSRNFSGTVYDVNKEPLIGVTVKVKDSQIGTITNDDGTFTLSATNSEATLVFTYVGYLMVEQKVTADKPATVIMKEDAKMLQETVVIGYGTTTKKEITGSVASLKPEDFNKGVFPDAMGMLQGKVAGLSVVNPGGANPMGTYEIILRGTNTLTSGQAPLIIIDGVVGESLRNIDFDEVESIDVLKDGSAAAIYGTRGTNGVIIITTKRAKAGKATVEYNGQATIQVMPRKVDNLSASQFEDAILTYAPDRSGSLYGANTDWFEEVTRSTPLSHRHSVAISSGSDAFSHRTTFSITENEGLLKKNDFQKYLFKTNIRQKALNDRLDIDLNATYSRRTYSRPNSDVLTQAFIYNPTAPVYNEDGSYYVVPDSGTEYYNPVAMLNERYQQGKTNDFTGSGRATLKIIDGLNWVNFFSFANSDWEDKAYKTSKYPALANSGDTGNKRRGEAEISGGSYQNKQYEMLLNYSKDINDHVIQAVAGYSFQEEMMSKRAMGNSDFDTDMLGTNDIGAGNALAKGQATMSSYKERSNLIAFFGRLMYNYSDRYLLSLSLRREGSSRFGKNNKWGWFPAASLGWRINEENFMKDVKLFDDLKLRVGYGVTGNQSFDNYRSLLLMDISGQFYHNGSWINSYGPTTNPEPDLKWEMKHEYNVGVDFSLLGGRLSGIVDVYYRQVKDALYEYAVPTPPYLHNKKFTNVGQLSNRGFELTLSGVPLKTDDFEWTTTASYTLNRNKLDKLSNAELTTKEIPTGWVTGVAVNSQRLIEGQSIGSFYGPVWLGTDENGQDIFKNADENGKVSTDDWEKIGTGLPDYTIGWNNSFRYKDWGLSFALRASIGGEVLNSYRLNYENWGVIGKENVIETQYTETPFFKGSSAYSSKYVEDATYLKMDNISLSYNVPIKFDYVSSIRLSLTAQDVFCITSYKGLDPELGLSGITPGIESLSNYPRTTSITLGVNVVF